MISVHEKLPPNQFDNLTIDVMCKTEEGKFIGYARVNEYGEVLDWTDAANGKEVLGVTHWNYLSVLQVYNEGQSFFTVGIGKQDEKEA